jgi:hypothetical protein
VLTGAGPLLAPLPAESDPELRPSTIPSQREHERTYLSTPDQ